MKVSWALRSEYRYTAGKLVPVNRKRENDLFTPFKSYFLMASENDSSLYLIKLSD